MTGSPEAYIVKTIIPRGFPWNLKSVLWPLNKHQIPVVICPLSSRQAKYLKWISKCIRHIWFDVADIYVSETFIPSSVLQCNFAGMFEVTHTIWICMLQSVYFQQWDIGLVPLPIMHPALLLTEFYSKTDLRSFLGVKLHVSVNCWSKGLLICYLVHTVHFRFYDSPQPFCRTIIYAMSHSGHGLFHALILELCLEYLAGILISSVAMKNRFCIRIFNKCLIISIKYELVVISFTYNVCNRKTII